MGKYEPPADEHNLKSRPIKIMLKNLEEAKKIIANSRKLADAPDHMKGFNLAFDASKKQRDTIRAMVAEAKQKSEQSPNLKFKVRGPPWAPYIKELKIKA